MDLSETNDEQKAFGAAMITLIVVSVAGVFLDLAFAVRSVVAISAGFVALLVASYYLTGSPLTVLEE